jgi:hypothetical protein
MNTGRKTARGARAGQVQSGKDETQRRGGYMLREEERRGVNLWCACPALLHLRSNCLTQTLKKFPTGKHEIFNVWVSSSDTVCRKEKKV